MPDRRSSSSAPRRDSAEPLPRGCSGLGELIVSFDVQKLLILIMSHLFIFAFISNILGGGS